MVILIIFLAVYVGMALGNWPGLALDRTGIALLGAILIIATNHLSLEKAIGYVDLSSIAILFSFMILSAQFYYSGFYTLVTEKVEKWLLSPSRFLLVIILVAGILSAVLINDIVCLAMAPLLITACRKKQLNPIPFLIGLACGSNIGSALTLIGNPQNMLIGQVMHLSFATYTLQALVPTLLGWLVAWWVIKKKTTRWHEESKEAPTQKPSYDAWQSKKGLIVLSLLLLLFFIFDIPRENLALLAAGLLLLSRQMASRMMLNFIDWQLLVLFIGLFIVNGQFNVAFQPFFQQFTFTSPLSLFAVSTLLSNLISNVPAVMLLLPFTKEPLDGTLLALSSTLAGNLFIVGSIANLIVVTQAAHAGIKITWKDHLSYGLPIGLITLIIAFCTLTLFLPTA